MASVQSKMVSGAFLMSLQKVLERFLGTISTLILVRLLAPEDFGLMAMCTVFIAAIELFTAFGFEVVLIQKQDAQRVHYDTAWTFKVLLGFGAGALLVACSWLIADYFAEPRLQPVLVALAAAFALRSMQNISIVDFQKHQMFERELLFRFTIKLIAFAVTIPIAYIYQTYWALVIGILASSTASLLLSYIMRPYMPRLTLAAAQEIFSFSSWLLLNNLLFFFRDRLPELMIGKLLGSAPLGFFSVSREVATVATSELGAAVNRAIFPGYAKLRSAADEFKSGILHVTAAMALICVPIGTGLIVVADRMVPIVLGEKWLETVSTIQWLASFGIIAAVTSNWPYVFNAMAQPQKITRMVAIQLLVFIPLAFTLVAEYGIDGVGMSLVASALAIIPYLFYQLRRATDIRLLEMLDTVFRPLVGAFIMGWMVHTVSDLLPRTQNLVEDGLWLALLVALGALTYLMSIALIWRITGARTDLVEYKMYEYGRHMLLKAE